MPGSGTEAIVNSSGNTHLSGALPLAPGTEVSPLRHVLTDSVPPSWEQTLTQVLSLRLTRGKSHTAKRFFQVKPDHFSSLPQTKRLHFPITTGEHGSLPRPGTATSAPHHHHHHRRPWVPPCGEPSDAAGSEPPHALSHPDTLWPPLVQNGLLKTERYRGGYREQKSEIREISPSECAKIRCKHPRNVSKQDKSRVSTNRPHES